jgi:putative tryptophan/tyrosine transport system substrate-binding protein
MKLCLLQGSSGRQNYFRDRRALERREAVRRVQISQDHRENLEGPYAHRSEGSPITRWIERHREGGQVLQIVTNHHRSLQVPTGWPNTARDFRYWHFASVSAVQRQMKRRELITLLGGAAIWPFAARAEKRDGVRRVGVIMGFAEDDEVWQTYLATFRRTLQGLGWTDGRNIRFDYRFTGDSEERMRSIAEEIVGLAPDVILVSTNSAVSATLNATRSIPIVFTWVSDPVGSGFVTNLPHPGGKITGFHNFEPAIGGKWLAYLSQIAPALRRVAVVYVPEVAPNVAFLRVIETAAPQMGLAVTPAEIRNAGDIERVVSAFGQQGGGLIVTPSALTATRRDLIISLAARFGLPAIYSFGFYAASGGLISYGINQLEQARPAASYVDQILRGVNPGDLPVQLPLKYELVINLKTAAALGITVPNSLQLLADEVIE